MGYNIKIATRSLYIHWPFYSNYCHCCSSTISKSDYHLMERYHKALIQEVKEFAQQSERTELLDTIYFGGGMLSTYSDHLLLDMFDILKNTFVIQKDTEITIEINPGTVEPAQLCLWKTVGINRLSVGVPPFNNRALSRLNRLKRYHTIAMFFKQVQGVFEEVSIDFLLKLPGAVIEEWKEMLRQAVTWPITHISMYMLNSDDKIPFYCDSKAKKVALPSDDELVDFYHWTRNFLAAYGLRQYEITSFAFPNCESKHNRVYWDRKPYKGFGIGACSFDGKSRFQNEKSIAAYIKGIESEKKIVTFAECLTKDQVRLEKIMINLRRSEGITWLDLLSGLSSEQKKRCKNEVVQLKQLNVIRESNGRLQLTPKGLVLENSITTRLSV